MALKTRHKEVEFGVGDVVRVHHRIVEAGKKGEKKERVAVFEGMAIRIKGREKGKTFTVRRIGAQKIGVEMIFPLESPLIEKIEVKRKGMRGVKRAKLFYIRDKSKKEVEKIYSRAAAREKAKEEKIKKKKAKSVKRKKTSKK